MCLKQQRLNDMQRRFTALVYKEGRSRKCSEET